MRTSAISMWVTDVIWTVKGDDSWVVRIPMGLIIAALTVYLWKTLRLFEEEFIFADEE